MNLHDFDIQMAAKQEGAAEKAVETAKNLLKMNLLSEEQIAQVTELSVEQVKELENEVLSTQTN